MLNLVSVSPLIDLSSAKSESSPAEVGRVVKGLLSSTSTRIEEYRENFEQLRKGFGDKVLLETRIAATRIMAETQAMRIVVTRVMAETQATSE